MNTDIAARRATVARLHATGHSLRTIAEQIGASKDTVARDVEAIEAAAKAAAARAAARHARRRLHRRARPARLRRPQPLRHRLAHATATATLARDASRDTEARPAASTPSGAPCLTVPVTPGLLRDLATLTGNGVSAETALAAAVWTQARAYRHAWDTGVYPRTADPHLTGSTYAPYTPLPPRPTQQRNRLDMIAT
ncbi:hypothetical protein [Streptomyces sp. NPDC057854]|uniref:hypothetical protein n=1 Tax=unclassified Streptomyces TaxID=2593676 RepID=UPI0036A62E74